MQVRRARPVLGAGRWSKRGWLVCLVAALLLPSLVHDLVTSDPSAGAAAVTRSASGHSAAALVNRQPSGLASPGARSSTTVGSSGATGTSDALSDTATVHALSMNAKIQGGLTAHQEQVLSAAVVKRHQTVVAAARSTYWTPAMGHTAVARAESWLGMPYSWAGGGSTGPSLGRCDPDNGGDLDCHIVGFDCSGLAMYAWGAYDSLPHLASAQVHAGLFHPTPSELRPGDLVFFAGYLPDGVGHVAIYAGHGTVIEAPQSGSVIRKTSLADVLASDGAYRGAVRPMTGRPPTLAASRTMVPSDGDLVTLHGTNLATVASVQIGHSTVRRFVAQSDSTLEFYAPSHAPGSVPMRVTTSWYAQSPARTLTYVAASQPVEDGTPLTLGG